MEKLTPAALKDKARNIRIYFDELPDDALPMISALNPDLDKQPRLTFNTKTKDRKFEAWDRSQPLYMLSEDGGSILKISLPKNAIIAIFELFSHPVNGDTPSIEHFTASAANLAAAQLLLALRERVECLLETANKLGTEVNQIYVPIRTSICGLHAPEKNGTEGYSIFANLGMAGFKTSTPVGIVNPWNDTILHTAGECPADLIGPYRARWVEAHVAKVLGMPAASANYKQG